MSEAWRLLLQNQPHDSICGCSVDQVHAEMRTRFDQADQIAEAIVSQSLAAIAGQVDTAAAPGAGPGHPDDRLQPVHPAADGPVGVHVQIPTAGPASAWRTSLADAIPHQVTGRQDLPFSTLGIDEAEIINRVGCGLEAAERIAGQSLLSLTHRVGGHELLITAVLGGHGLGDPAAIAAAAAEIQASPGRPRAAAPHPGERGAAHRLSFVARGVPGCGYATYFVRPCGSSRRAVARQCSQRRVHRTPRRNLVLENELFRLAVDPATAR